MTGTLFHLSKFWRWIQLKKKILWLLEFEKMAADEVKIERHISPGEAQFLWQLIQAHGNNYKVSNRNMDIVWQQGTCLSLYVIVWLNCQCQGVKKVNNSKYSQSQIVLLVQLVSSFSLCHLWKFSAYSCYVSCCYIKPLYWSKPFTWTNLPW